MVNAVRFITRDSRRSILLTIIIALSMSLITTMLLMKTSVEESAHKFARSVNGGDISIIAVIDSFDRTDLLHLDRLKRKGEIQDYYYGISAQSTIRNKSGLSSLIFIRAFNSYNEVNHSIQVQEPVGGDLNQVLANYNDIAIRSDVAQRLNLKIGDKVTLYHQLTGETFEATVKGIVNPLNELTGDIKVFGSVYTRYDFAKTVAGFTGKKTTEIYILTQDAKVSQRLVDKITALFPDGEVNTSEEVLEKKLHNVQQLCVALVRGWLGAFVYLFGNKGDIHRGL